MMNKFLKKIFWENGNYFRNAERPLYKSPLIDAFSFSENMQYQPLKHQTLYQLMMKFSVDIWINDNQENNQFVKNDCKEMAIKRIHHEIFGDIESYLHELRLHLHNDDCESSKKVIDLIQAIIKGDD